VSQTAIDLDDDGAPEIVGFSPEDAANAKICVQPVSGTASCADTPFGMDEVRMQIGELGMPGAPDLLLVHDVPGGGQTDVFVVPDLQYDGTATIGTVGPPGNYAIDTPQVTHGRFGTAVPPSIVLMAGDGTTICLRPMTNSTAPCAN